MDITSASLAAIRRSINTAWAQGLEWKPPIDTSFLVRDFPSAGASELYPWADFSSKFREWVGDRVWNSLSANLFEVFNRPFEKSEKARADLIKDDKFGVFVNARSMDAAAWKQLLHDIAMAVVTQNAACYDGKALLANDHAYGANTIDNLVTDALSSTSFETAFVDSGNWMFANGVLVRPKWTHLCHGPKLYGTAFDIVDAETLTDGKPNRNYHRCQRVEIPDFAGDYDDYWCLVDSTQPIKVVSRQIREEPVPKTNDLEDIEETGEIKFMASGRAAAAPTFPHLIYGGIL